jgi:hypothetical protein
MKTAISIPDPLFKIADETAREMGIPRSQLFSLAVEEYLFHHSKAAVTKRLNEIYKDAPSMTAEKKGEFGLSELRKAVEHDSW